MAGVSDDDNGLLNERINVRGYFERILRERDLREAERDRRYQERFEAQEKELSLAAAEYARRLHDLNGEYKRDRERQAQFVSMEKFEDKLRTDAERLRGESIAREAALLRVDEKFDEYVKRYEADKRETDLALALHKGAAEQAKQAAEEQGRKANRNLGIATFTLAILVAAANWIGAL